MLSTLDQIDSAGVIAPSQATAAYKAIRADLLSGRHAPGKKLKIQELSAELQVSPGAVREALSKLVPEQLVVSQDQRGFAVARLSIDDLVDLTDLRCEIEAIALRRSVARGKLDWEARIVATAHRLNATPQRNGQLLNPDWVATHADFHAALIGACGSPRLLRLHWQLYEQSERYRGLSIHFEADRNVAAEHRAIVDMALARDADALIANTLDHIRTTTRLIIDATQARVTLG